MYKVLVITLDLKVRIVHRKGLIIASRISVLRTLVPIDFDFL